MISQVDGAVFVFGVEFVWEGLGEGIIEHSHGLTERDAVLFEVGGGFGWVELEAQTGGSSCVGCRCHSSVGGGELSGRGLILWSGLSVVEQHV